MIVQGTLDVDSHEMVPSHLWGREFGEASSQIAELLEPMLKPMAEVGSNDLYNPSVVDDAGEINDEIVWNTKGTSAPGAIDPKRRLEVLDAMGISRQLIFPSYGLLALMIIKPNSPTRNWLRTQDVDLTDEDLEQLGRAGLEEYNAWAVRATLKDPDRLRVVGYLPPCSTPEDLLHEANALIDQKIRVVHVAHGVPPGGRSPAHPDLDPFWALLAESEVVCTTHLGAETGFVDSLEWVKAPAFELGKVESHEFGLEPYSFATLHMPISNFLTCMVLGGVFERYPNLRFAAIELGSGWLGPLADNLDMWARDMYATRLAPFISKLPSEYLASNVRVTPFNDVEPVEEYLKRYPHLRTCYCYSSDYPHLEGGKDSANRLAERVAPLGDEVLQMFFVQNARLLFP